MRAVLLCSLLLGVGSQPVSPPPEDPDAFQEGLAVEWSEEHSPLVVPRAERLVYRVRAGVGGLEAPVGTVTMEAGVEPYRESIVILDSTDGDASRESGRMRIHAAGDYKFFSMDATIESRVLPVRWPFLVYNFSQTGSKNRKQEVLLGWEDGRPLARYRRDTTRGAPRGTRIWKAPTERRLPLAPLDMVSASYFARTMVLEDRLIMQFPVADKLDLWEITLRRGKAGRVETGVGAFRALQIVLDPRPYPGEEEDEGVEKKVKTFEGLFGLQGSISFWVEERTGVPVLITGDLPVGPLTVAVSVVLQSYSGTPPAFQPLR